MLFFLLHELVYKYTFISLFSVLFLIWTFICIKFCTIQLFLCFFFVRFGFKYVLILSFCLGLKRFRFSLITFCISPSRLIFHVSQPIPSWLFKGLFCCYSNNIRYLFQITLLSSYMWQFPISNILSFNKP